ncbi:hypothetical protein ACSVHC_22590 [Arthrobacter sp. KNU-44]|uniref:hypothetical protein n=1 Tax=unclassified Arthrobacter TaxID=235627 RepID=UPI003F42B139
MGGEASRARIVVGVDGSEASLEALRQAQSLAVPLEPSREADMIDLGRRGHGGFGGLLPGSRAMCCSCATCCS